jgi:alpha-galactosidase/6-phospho-beta-glucosidase family protein
MVHPLIGDYHKVAAVLDEMIEANKQFLPKGFCLK